MCKVCTRCVEDVWKMCKMCARCTGTGVSFLFFLLAKWRHTPPLATTHEYGLVHKDQENVLSGFLGWPENELQVFFSINVLRLLCSVVAARLPLLQQFGWASPLKILIHLVCEQSCLVRGLVRFIKSRMESLNNINLPFNVALA